MIDLMRADTIIEEKINVDSTVFRKRANEGTFTEYHWGITEYPVGTEGIGLGSVVVRKNSTAESGVILRLNVPGVHPALEFIISVNYGEVIFRSSVVLNGKKRVEIDLDNIEDVTKTKVLWQKLENLTITIDPYNSADMFQRNEDRPIFKENFNFERFPPPRKVYVTRATNLTIAFKSVQALLLREHSGDEYYEVPPYTPIFNDDNAFRYPSNQYSWTKFEFKPWQEHNLYESVANIYQMDEMREHQTMNQLGDAVIGNLVLDSKNDQSLPLHFTFEGALGNVYPQNFQEIVKINWLTLKIVDATYYDYVAKTVKLGVAADRARQLGYQIPYNYSGLLTVKIALDISTFFRDVEIYIDHFFEKALLDYNSGQVQLSVKESVPSIVSTSQNTLVFGTNDFLDIAKKANITWEFLQGLSDAEMT